MRPADLPPAEHFPHGTRARYVTGCRCRPCKDSNNAYYHAHQAKQLAALAEIEAGPPEAPIGRKWTKPDGSVAVRRYKNACPGLEMPCQFGSYLRRDSKGGICGRCRYELVSDYLVDAGPARAHLLRLSRMGVGRRAVSDAGDVPASILHEVRAGRRRQIRRSTERKILGTDRGAAAAGAIVRAAPTLKLIDRLLKEGFTRGELARRLGYKTRALQLRGPTIKARNALRVAKYYRLVMAE